MAPKEPNEIYKDEIFASEWIRQKHANDVDLALAEALGDCVHRNCTLVRDSWTYPDFPSPVHYFDVRCTDCGAETFYRDDDDEPAPPYSPRDMLNRRVRCFSQEPVLSLELCRSLERDGWSVLVVRSADGARCTVRKWGQSYTSRPFPTGEAAICSIATDLVKRREFVPEYL